MKREIHYLNTDLDLVAPSDLAALAAALTLRGLLVLQAGPQEDGSWAGRFEADETFAAPDANIAALCSAIERLDAANQALWQSCTTREFNIGYDSGEKPWAFHQSIGPATLARIAALGASLRITIYPESSGESRDDVENPAD